MRACLIVVAAALALFAALLARSRVSEFRASLWLDGAIVGLAVAASAAVLASQPIIAAAEGNGLAVVVGLSYPIGDITLLAMLMAIFGISGWRPGRGLALMAAGLAVMAVADGVFLVQAVAGTYVEGTLVDAVWLAAALLMGLAAWQPASTGVAPRLEGRCVMLFPLAAALLVTALSCSTTSSGCPIRRSG